MPYNRTRTPFSTEQVFSPRSGEPAARSCWRKAARRRFAASGRDRQCSAPRRQPWRTAPSRLRQVPDQDDGGARQAFAPRLWQRRSNSCRSPREVEFVGHYRGQVRRRVQPHVSVRVHRGSQPGWEAGAAAEEVTSTHREVRVLHRGATPGPPPRTPPRQLGDGNELVRGEDLRANLVPCPLAD